MVDVQNIPRWMFASVSKHFDALKQSEHLFIEGQDRLTNKQTDWLELRMDGPSHKEVSKGCHQFDIEVNVLVSSTMNETDYHKIFKLVGVAAAAFTNKIDILKLGNGVSDDDTLLECARIRLENRELIQISHFGQIDTDKRLVQATVEGHYRMEVFE